MQQRTLIRTRGLAGFRRALEALALEGGALPARRRVIIVPTRASGELLRQTIERHALANAAQAVILPDLVTRDEWIGRLHLALPGAPPLLPDVEREVLLERAAGRAATRRGVGGEPFTLRPGLVSAMLGLYDELRRRQRTVRRFARALFDQLRVERGTDRGSESLLRQTMFLGYTFLGYERAVAASGGMDEHQLRDRLLARQPELPVDHVVIAVADHPADPRGLWPADFDLLGRLTRLARVDVVMTDESHDAGFRDRLEQELPGIVESRWPDAARGGVLVRPPAGDDGDTPVCYLSRDREEELRDVARTIVSRALATGGRMQESTAIVFHRPLPYLYLAQQILSEARVPYQAFDALPLAAEPYAALLDQVLAVARTAGARDAVVALLRSTQMQFGVDGEVVGARDAAALDGVLRERRSSGDASTFEGDVDAFFGARPMRRGLERARALRAARAARVLAASLDVVRAGARGSAQVGAVAAFLRACERQPDPSDPWGERHLRARAAVLGVLDGLAQAYARHDDRPRGVDAITAAILHAVETRTFSPRRGQGGVHLVDAVAARFGDFDHVHLVGLVETDWPERPRRSVFYTSGLLKSLSWPQETDQMQAQQAAFRDLLGLASATTRLHAFLLEGDAIVARSPILAIAAGLPAEDAPPDRAAAVFADEVMTGTAVPVGLDPEQAGWLALRRARPSLHEPAYSGDVPPQPPQAYRVSRVDRYADCPFKYFAASVLELPEERDEAAGLTPLERGTLLHDLFEQFYRRWHGDGLGAIHPGNLPEAMSRFADLARATLDRLPPADRALEATRLLGSLVSRGVAERVFELEADAGRAVVDRLLEVELQGQFPFPLLHGLRQTSVEIRAKADRIDVYDDGSIGVYDYKLGMLPDEHSVQVAVYAHCASILLAGPDGQPRRIRSASYLAFGDDHKLEGQVARSGTASEVAVLERAGQFAAHVEQIEAGRFPARPRRATDCQWCAFAGVCRKEYRVEDDDAADAV
jgi:RecB family exonuclease